jgi:aspartyl/asparaginyl beta-hydroxylase (cupin superfamily)
LAYSLLALPNLAIRSSTEWKSRAPFYDASSVCPALALLEANFDAIRKEYDHFKSLQIDLPGYDKTDPIQARIATPKKPGEQWSVLFFEAMGRRSVSNRKLFPFTTSLIDRVPGVFQSCISILEGGKSIPPHRSPYNGYLRYHLAIEVPEHNAPIMRVGGTWLSWQVGRGFLFDDTIEHEIVNRSDCPRAVLIVDIARPASALGRWAHAVATAIMSTTYARGLIRRSAVLE